MRSSLLIPAFITLLSLTACSSSGDNAASPTAPSPVATTAPSPESAEPVAVATTDAAATEAPPADSATEAPLASDPMATFEMPNVVGMNLQNAQDLLQAHGSYLMDQQDASGLSRVQINDSNWQVCTQSPEPGTSTTIDTTITLAAVKLSETCP